MKTIRLAIWILGALLVLATLDSQPDPPAVNPSTARCAVLQHDCVCDTANLSCDSLSASFPSPVRLVAADASEPYRPSDRMMLTVHAADPSPPQLFAGREQSFQS